MYVKLLLLEEKTGISKLSLGCSEGHAGWKLVNGSTRETQTEKVEKKRRHRKGNNGWHWTTKSRGRQAAGRTKFLFRILSLPQAIGCAKERNELS